MNGPALFDTHCHLDFFCDPTAVARDASARGIGFLAATVDPAGHDLLQGLNLPGCVRIGAGLHPWWVADGRCGADEVARAAELARESRYVAEVGLDFSDAHTPSESHGAQVEAFECIARACADGGKVLSIHAVRSASTVLDILEETGSLAANTCIFHWFSGTSDELARAVRASCLFSVNRMMLATRRGREYARQVPADRLLTETDLPEEGDSATDAQMIAESLAEALAVLEDLRGPGIRERIALSAGNLLLL